MRVLAWNIGHRIRQKAIPADLPDLFDSVGADVVLLNEYVEQRPRPEFREWLRARGYQWQQVSATPAVHNQVLAAARVPFVLGDLTSPTLGARMDGPAIAGFLHIRFADRLEMVGFRAPAYEKKADKVAYWAELSSIMKSVVDRPILLAGDVNKNPFKEARMAEAATVEFAECAGFRLANPAGDWSFRDPNGRGVPTRIDHVLHTRSVQVTGARYLARHDRWVLAGLQEEHPISDHAALLFEADLVPVR